jgi:Protein of unknown function (DUF4019)
MKLLTAVLLGAMCRAAPALAQNADSAGAAVTAAQVSARSWLGLMDQARYAEGWDSSASVFRKAVTKPSWEVAARQARAPFGPLGARKLLGASFQTRLPNVPPGEYVVLQYQTTAGGGRTVVETVTPMKDTDGTWRVSGYYIRPE